MVLDEMTHLLSDKVQQLLTHPPEQHIDRNLQNSHNTHACVCEREKETETERQRERETERENVCTSVYTIHPGTCTSLHDADIGGGSQVSPSLCLHSDPY